MTRRWPITLAVPYVMSDDMPLVEQVDGRFYTSKREFRCGACARVDRGGQRKAPARAQHQAAENEARTPRPAVAKHPAAPETGGNFAQKPIWTPSDCKRKS
jgi:hypothetical protein